MEIVLQFQVKQIPGLCLLNLFFGSGLIKNLSPVTWLFLKNLLVIFKV